MGRKFQFAYSWYQNSLLKQIYWVHRFLSASYQNWKFGNFQLSKSPSYVKNYFLISGNALRKWPYTVLCKRNLTRPSLCSKMALFKNVFHKIKVLPHLIPLGSKSKILFPTSRLCVHPLVSPLVRTCVRRLAPIPAGESQDVTNKSCSICLMGDPWGPGCSRT